MKQIVLEEQELKKLKNIIKKNKNNNNLIIKLKYKDKLYEKPTKSLDNLEDYLSTIECFNIKDKRKRIEYIYDYLCYYFDKDMRKNNYCEFQSDGTCIANRLGYSVHKKDGCCYNRKTGLCQYLKENGCINPNPSCKIFMCEYLNNIKKVPNYDTHKVYLTKCFFNYKEHSYFRRHYFITKQEYINGYMKKIVKE